MANFFSYDGKVNSFIRRGTELLMINTFWLVCCIPVITIGPATAAMYYTIQKCILHGRGYVGREFFRCFKDNIKQGMALWGLYLATGLWFIADIYYFYSRWKEGNSIGLLWFLFAGLILFLLLLVIYTFAYLARFENSLRKTMKDSFLIMLLHFNMNIKIAALLIVLAFSIYLVNLLLLILPAIAMLMVCRSMERIFRKYMSKEDQEHEDALNQQGEGLEDSVIATGIKDSKK